MQSGDNGIEPVTAIAGSGHGSAFQTMSALVDAVCWNVASGIAVGDDARLQTLAPNRMVAGKDDTRVNAHVDKFFGD